MYNCYNRDLLQRVSHSLFCVLLKTQTNVEILLLTKYVPRIYQRGRSGIPQGKLLHT